MRGFMEVCHPVKATLPFPEILTVLTQHKKILALLQTKLIIGNCCLKWSRNHLQVAPLCTNKHLNYQNFLSSPQTLLLVPVSTSQVVLHPFLSLKSVENTDIIVYCTTTVMYSLSRETVQQNVCEYLLWNVHHF